MTACAATALPGRGRALQASNAGSLLLFDVNNIRYVSATKIGEWERDKMCRFCLLTGDDSPYVWDFGSAAVHHQRYSDWLEPDHCLAGVVGMRGTIPPEFGLMKKYAKMIAQLIKDAGMADMPVGVDYAETAMFHALQEEGIKVVDGQQIMLGAREIKNWDEIQLLTQAASMVDGVYHMIYEELKPGVRENDIVALSNKLLYEMGSDDVEAINAISGERCNPHPHNFTDRLFRPGDQAFFDILQSYQGYRTCYYRTFNIGRATPAQNDAYVKAREWIDASIEHDQAGRDDGQGGRRSGRRRKASASRTRTRPSGCSSATGWAWRCTSGRSSAAPSASITRWRSRPAWSSRWKPTARPPTATPPRGSRKRSS
jgi:Xaa-Pro aminopeptidase